MFELFAEMRADQVIDSIQAAALITTSGCVIYAFGLLRRQLRQSVIDLRQLLQSQTELLRTRTEMEERIERIWKRIDDIEMRNGLRGDVDELARVKRFMDALDASDGKPKTPR
jgi:hypothetical protein